MRWTLIDYSNLAGKKKTLVYLLFVIILGAQFAFILYQISSRDQRSAPFSIQVSPNRIDDGVVGRPDSLSVTVADVGNGSLQGEAVEIVAYAPGATVAVNPEMIAPGEVAEIVVTPGEAAEGKNLTVTILGKRRRKEKVTANIMVSASQR
jgi:hypothetical protein